MVGAVVDRALMSGRTEMLIQAHEFVEAFLAEVAFVTGPIPGGTSGGCFDEILAGLF